MESRAIVVQELRHLTESFDNDRKRCDLRRKLVGKGIFVVEQQ